ncbi:helix-turn-helix domain-containing protein [Breznakia pachnodae]|uniref:Cytoskeletal protein RodZ n=1 Tax=Breznakia pachnodae TaxID=265178 RepID=A0ABU0DY87_9FIRM|nr:helix-turn-helix transcriptional regulator [Breznakia pachnodae]MDQ0359604.1 cytoskeletal protein RodZ [Breznakia pachnodae]
MKDIGLKLSAKRKELKLSVNDVAKMTKMPVSHIKAIEAGDIGYFEDDITYLRFYVRAYCKALDIPFDEVKENFDDSIDEFTQTISLKAIKEREEMEENIQAKKSKPEVPKSENYKEPPVATVKDRGSIRQNANQSSRFSKRPKLDVSLLSLIAIIAIVVAIVIFVVVNNGFGGSSDDTTKDPVVTDNNTPDPEKETDTDDDNKETDGDDDKKAEGALTINTVDATNYEIEGLKDADPLKIEITISDDTLQSWFGLSVVSGEYIYQTTATSQNPFEYDGTATLGTTYTLTVGKFSYNNMKITINGQEITLDKELATSTYEAQNFLITFTLKGQ